MLQVMLCVEATTQASPPLGAVTVMFPLILKLAPEVAVASGSVTSVIFTLKVVPILSGIVQEYEPELGVVNTMVLG